MARETQTKSRAPARPWPVTALGLLLLLQAAGLALIGAFNIRYQALEVTPDALLVEVHHTARGMLFVLLAVSALLTAFGFLRVRPGAWRSAMLVQGLSLLMALIIYFIDRPAYGYLMMLYSIFMVIYLNHDDVLAAFRPMPVFTDRAQDR